jgi:hypothetical protein
MLGLLVGACLCFSSNPSPAEIAAFKAAYQSRKADSGSETPDPGISKALNLLVKAVKKDESIEPYQKAIAKPEDQSYFSDYSSIDGLDFSFDKLRFIVVRMGQITRTVAYDGTKPLHLPANYSWNYWYFPKPHRFKSGLVMFEENSIQDASSRVGLRLSWLFRKGNSLRLVRRMTSAAVLDQLPITIKGERVIVPTIDPFKTLFVSMSTVSPERITTWDCSTTSPKIVKTVLRDQELRAVDAAIYHSWITSKPTAQDRLIRKRLPKDELIDAWTVKKSSNGRANVTIGDALVFHLKKTKSGFKVESVSPVVISTIKHRQ